MVPSYCKSATRFDVLEEVRLMVSLAHAVNELALLGLHPSVSAEPRVPEVKSAPVAGNRKQFIPVTSSTSMATSRRVSEFPDVFGISSELGQQGGRWRTTVHTTSTSTSGPARILQSFDRTCKSCKHPPVDHVQTSSSTARTRLRDRRRSAQQGGQWVCRCRRVSLAATRTWVLCYMQVKVLKRSSHLLAMS